MPEEIILPEEPSFRLKYALLTEEQYNNLNTAIGAAKGYSATNATQRYAPEEHMHDVNDNCVMPITAEVQEHYPEIIEGIELVDSYEPAIEPEI
jgi:hypothetical protein